MPCVLGGGERGRKCVLTSQRNQPPSGRHSLQIFWQISRDFSKPTMSIWRFEIDRGRFSDMHASCYLQGVHHRPLLQSLAGQSSVSSFPSHHCRFLGLLRPGLCLETWKEPSAQQSGRTWVGSLDNYRAAWGHHCPHCRAEGWQHLIHIPSVEGTHLPGLFPASPRQGDE